jgi:hypothetical protein
MAGGKRKDGTRTMQIARRSPWIRRSFCTRRQWDPHAGGEIACQESLLCEDRLALATCMTTVVAISDDARAVDQAVTRLAREAFEDTVSKVIRDFRAREFRMLAAVEPSGGHRAARDDCVCISVAAQIENRFFTSTDDPRWPDPLRVQP